MKKIFLLIIIACGLSACDKLQDTIFRNQIEKQIISQSQAEELSRQVLNDNFRFNIQDNCYIYEANNEEQQPCVKIKSVDIAENKIYFTADTDDTDYPNHGIHVSGGLLFMYVIQPQKNNKYQILAHRKEEFGKHGYVGDINFIQFGKHTYGWIAKQNDYHMDYVSIFAMLFAYHNNHIEIMGDLYAVSSEAGSIYDGKMEIKPQPDSQEEFAPLKVNISGDNVKKEEYIVPFDKNKEKYIFDTIPLKAEKTPEDFFNQAVNATENGNYAQAAEWYEQACGYSDYETKIAAACNNLGVLYAKGQGVKQNYHQAAKFYGKACDGGVVQSCSTLGYFYHNGTGVKQNQTQAAQFFEKSCNGGIALDCVFSARFYEDGLGVKQNYTKAAKLYEQACNNGEINGCQFLGTLYYHGRGVRQDYAKAFKLHEHSCHNGDSTACSYTAISYEAGEGVRQNYFTAKEYYRKACILGSKDSCVRYEQLHQRGVR